jgi:hypothetical protein
MDEDLAEVGLDRLSHMMGGRPETGIPEKARSEFDRRQLIAPRKRTTASARPAPIALSKFK